MLFSGAEPVAAAATSGPPDGSGFERLAVGALEATVDEPLRRWTVRLAGDDGFDLAFEAAGTPAQLDGTEAAARTGGMEGYEQLCHVHGTVHAGGRSAQVRCLGQRGHSWGRPDWDRIEATRSVGAWIDDGSAVTLSAVRPTGSSGHDGEATWAAVLGAAGSLRVDEPRLSTTYDGDGRQRRATLELWVGEDDAYPRRAAGEVVCGSTLELGRLRLDCAFLRWRMDGRSGAGRYDVLRRA